MHAADPLSEREPHRAAADLEPMRKRERIDRRSLWPFQDPTAFPTRDARSRRIPPTWCALLVLSHHLGSPALNKVETMREAVIVEALALARPWEAGGNLSRSPGISSQPH